MFIVSDYNESYSMSTNVIFWISVQLEFDRQNSSRNAFAADSKLDTTKFKKVWSKLLSQSRVLNSNCLTLK